MAGKFPPAPKGGKAPKPFGAKVPAKGAKVPAKPAPKKK